MCRQRNGGRCCSQAARSSFLGAAKVVLVLVNSCAAFMSVVVLSAGVLVISTDPATVTGHMWTKVKKLARYASITSVQFTSDSAYTTCFQTPANILSIAGICGLLVAGWILAVAICGPGRRPLCTVATVSGICLVAALAGILSVGVTSDLQTRARTSLSVEFQSWIGVANQPLNSSAVAPFAAVFVDYLQMTKLCCGWRDYRDFQLAGAAALPASCCLLDPTTQNVVDAGCPAGNVSSLGWLKVGCSGLYDDVLTRNLPELSLATGMLLLSAVSATAMACLTGGRKDFVKQLREAAME